MKHPGPFDHRTWGVLSVTGKSAVKNTAFVGETLAQKGASVIG